MKITEASGLSVSPAWQRAAVAAMLSTVLGGCAALTGSDRGELPVNTSEFRSRLYTGVSFGSSRLTPDTSGTVFNLNSDSDLGTQLRLGYDVHNLLAVELDTSILGAAELAEANTDVKYTSAAVSALLYALGGAQVRSRREGLSAFGRLGYGVLTKSSAVLDLEDSGAAPIVGLGAEYGFMNGLGVRAEITRFDSDARYIGFGAIYRFGMSPAGIGKMIADAAEPVLAGAHGTEAPLPAGESVDNKASTVADRWRPSMRADDQDSDGVLDDIDSCPGTPRFITVDRDGCGLFDAVLDDVTFNSGSQWLSPRARGQLDQVADTMLAFPEARIQVRAHTDSLGAAELNLALSSRRAEAVVQYLISRGVNELQLQAMGIGEAQPLDSNGSGSGRKRNRRVDVVTLPDLDAGTVMVTENTGSARVVSIGDPARVQPGHDSYTVVAKNATKPWSSSVRSSAASSELIEPGLRAASPATTKAETLQLGMAPSPEHDNAEASGRGRLQQRLLLTPLPEPGFAPGLGIAGVVKGLSFPRGETILTEEAKVALKPVVEGLHDYQDVSIAIMAHTDDQGDDEDNLALSKARAEAVLLYIVQTGIDASRLKAEGYGELLPLVQNLTVKDRARNRRVEIRILPKK